MLRDLYKNNSYQVLKRTTENRSAWRESTRRKVPKPIVQQITRKDHGVQEGRS